jgi:glutathione S-transferase
VKLYTFPVAPNPTKVNVYLAEKGIEVPTERVSMIEGAQRSPEFLAKNPRGKLPVLELDDGSTVCESLAIIEYFEELHPEPSMWGRTPQERAHARALERFCDLGVLIPLARYIHSTDSPLGLPANPAVAKQAWEDLETNLSLLDQKIGAGPFAGGERVSVADCTLCGAFGFAHFRSVEIPKEFGHVHAWWKRFVARPSVQAQPGSPAVP